ncbi:MAG: DUF1330 domain-containing protein [Betaproteobacteria bacterium]|nr:MAG: DUF1330 domain-containing protein [Betaproteobacteria bacterium]
MAAYVVTLVNVTDPEKFQEYGKLAGPISARYGGRFIVRGGPKTNLEGDIPYARVVVTEFPDVEAAKRFYYSAEYQEAKEKRLGAADFNMVILEGA